MLEKEIGITSLERSDRIFKSLRESQEANLPFEPNKFKEVKIIAIQQLTMNQLSQEMQQCIQNCLDCHSICLNTVTYCLQKGGMHSEPAHIRLMLDCAEICQTSANFMLRGSELHARVCGVCSEVCERCADDCVRMGDDPQMKACADMCHRCAEPCRNMAMSMT